MDQRIQDKQTTGSVNEDFSYTIYGFLDEIRRGFFHLNVAYIGSLERTGKSMVMDNVFLPVASVNVDDGRTACTISVTPLKTHVLKANFLFANVSDVDSKILESHVRLDKIPFLELVDKELRIYHLPLIPIDIPSAVNLVANIELISEIIPELSNYNTEYAMIAETTVSIAEKVARMKLPKIKMDMETNYMDYSDTLEIRVNGRHLLSVEVWREYYIDPDTRYGYIVKDFVKFIVRTRNNKLIHFYYGINALGIKEYAESLKEILVLTSSKDTIRELHRGLKVTVELLRKAVVLTETFKRELYSLENNLT